MTTSEMTKTADVIARLAHTKHVGRTTLKHAGLDLDEQIMHMQSIAASGQGWALGYLAREAKDIWQTITAHRDALDQACALREVCIHEGALPPEPDPGSITPAALDALEAAERSAANVRGDLMDLDGAIAEAERWHASALRTSPWSRRRGIELPPASACTSGTRSFSSADGPRSTSSKANDS